MKYQLLPLVFFLILSCVHPTTKKRMELDPSMKQILFFYCKNQLKYSKCNNTIGVLKFFDSGCDTLKIVYLASFDIKRDFYFLRQYYADSVLNFDKCLISIDSGKIKDDRINLQDWIGKNIRIKNFFRCNNYQSHLFLMSKTKIYRHNWHPQNEFLDVNDNHSIWFDFKYWKEVGWIDSIYFKPMSFKELIN